MTTTLTDLTVLNDLRARLEAVTQEQIDSYGRRLNKPRAREEVLGTVEQHSTKALYTLWMMLSVETNLNRALSQSAIDKEAEQELLQKAVIADMFSDVAEALFWVQLKVDLGLYEPPDQYTVGLRHDWSVVKTLRDDDGDSIVKAMMLRLGQRPE